MKSEELGLWYLRLNGFLTIANFVVHPRAGSAQGTDIDVLGVRFPYRRELVESPLFDDKVFDIPLPQVVFVEIKASRCALNGPWTKPEKQNMQNALFAVGAVPPKFVDAVASSLYRCGKAEHAGILFRLVCIGAEPDDDISRKYPEVPQILWSQVEEFIYRRFQDNSRRKVAHPQWDAAEQKLWDEAVAAKSVEHFRNRIRAD